MFIKVLSPFSSILKHTNYIDELNEFVSNYLILFFDKSSSLSSVIFSICSNFYISLFEAFRIFRLGNLAN